MKHIIIKCTNIDRLSALIPLLLMENSYDVIDLFANDNEKVTEYCKSLTKHYSKTIKYHGESETNTLHDKKIVAVDGDYYIYLNENVTYLEKGTISKLFTVKEKTPQYFLTTPLTINHWLGCYLLQNNGKYGLDTDITYQYEEALDGNDFIHTNGEEAERIHNQFIKVLENGEGLTNVHCPNFECCTRFPMVCVCWEGSAMGKLLDEYDIFNDEPFFTFQYPAKMGMKNLVIGSKVIANYAYEPQEGHLDNTDILARYASINANIHKNNKNYTTTSKWCKKLKGDEVEVDKGKLTIFRLVAKDDKEQRIKDDWHKTLCLNAVNCKKRKVYDYFDDEGTNISEKYAYYGNLTGIYWLMKHMPKNIRYVGTETPNAKWDMTSGEVSRGMAVYDVIVPNQVTNNNITQTYTQSHSEVDFAALKGIIKAYFPDYYTTWLNIMNEDGQMGFIKNCVVAKREVFIKMWRFIFDVLDKFREVFNIRTDGDIVRHVEMFSLNSAPQEMEGDWITYQSRLFEYMAERLVTLYIYRHYKEIGLGRFTLS